MPQSTSPQNASPLTYDLLVVGGGINGVGIANHAAQAGLQVLLVEQGDLGGATSSASSKLIHGGLRYLEQYEFRLVRESLAEREVLMDMAPHLIWPLQFILPHHDALRSPTMIRLGLFLYDHLGRRKQLPDSKGLDLRRDPVGAPLQPRFERGFAYADCWVDDARLVVANAQQAHEHGAHIQTRTRLDSARREGFVWVAELALRGGVAQTVQARALVNAAGPWVEHVLRQRLGSGTRGAIRLVKGSHIVVPRLHEGPQAYILQHPDRRVIFVLPYEGAFSLVGTTEAAFSGNPAKVEISPEEVHYLCEAVNGYFAKSITPQDVVWSYAGVRPLYDDHAEDLSTTTRDYVLRMERRKVPLLSVFGGKLTTYRQVARHVLEELGPMLGARPLPDPPLPLPGGEMPNANFEAFLTCMGWKYPWLPEALRLRLARNYGSRMERLLAGAHGLQDLGDDLGAGLYGREVHYLVENEWAKDASDVLWRRTKRGLHMNDRQRRLFATWFRMEFG